MSETHRSTRFLAVAVMVAAAVSLFAPTALAATPGDVCGEFPYTQAYDPTSGMLRAPAWHYDKAVTVVYDAESCATTGEDLAAYLLTIEGTATVFAGDDVKAEPIDKRHFSSVLRSNTTGGELGWPINWWSCFNGDFSYVWSIDDVYTFAVTAKNGKWLMTQTDPGAGDSLGTSFNGCRKRSSSRS